MQQRELDFLKIEEYLSDFTYNTSGQLFNKHGRKVGSYTKRYGRLFTKYGTLQMSRVLWWMHYGRWPKGEIDHIDGNPHNDSLLNLRECSRGENAKNRRAYTNNTTGYKGVYPMKYKGRTRAYGARIQDEGNNVYLGSFKTAEEAAEAYNEAALNLHKDFSSLNDI